MSDRSADETISQERDSEPQSTDELLADTERLLDDLETGSPATDEPDRLNGETLESAPEQQDDSKESSRSIRDSIGARIPNIPRPSPGGSGARSWSIRRRLSLGRYFSPRWFLGLMGALSVGMLAGGMIIPIAGRMIGTFAAAFLIGLLTTKRRYLEITIAGLAVGGVSAIIGNVIFTIAGSGGTIAAIGATAGFIASIVGYYLGRDLKSGLSGEPANGTNGLE